MFGTFKKLVSVFCTAAARSAALIDSPTAPVLTVARPRRITPACFAPAGDVLAEELCCCDAAPRTDCATPEFEDMFIELDDEPLYEDPIEVVLLDAVAYICAAS